MPDGEIPLRQSECKPRGDGRTLDGLAKAGITAGKPENPLSGAAAHFKKRLKQERPAQAHGEIA